jgi:acetyl esterase/lipase
MKRFSPLLATLLMLGWSATGRGAEGPTTLDVWPGSVPGETGGIGDEKVQESKPGEKPVKRLTNVTKPTITVFRPAKENDTGASVLICPGGGYNILAWDLEGEEVATWLNSIGVTGIVLKYRVPRRKDQPPHQAPLQDAQRALSLVRSKADAWGLDPKRIGILGFSAGGNLSALAATNSDKRGYETIDDVDRVSCRPDFTILIYPAYLVQKNQLDLAPEVRVTSETPPTFLAHAGDDGIGPENSIALYLALKKAKIPAELHVFNSGGHGFGLRPSEHPCSHWPQRCEEWLRSLKLIGRAEKAP